MRKNLIKHLFIIIIIFSNNSFGKVFSELFTIYEPIENSSKIEKSINNAFNTMIYRLSGSNSPSNVWKIINDGNKRKDFITSYSITKINHKNYLQVNFDKSLLLSKFQKLSISPVGLSRPTILLIIKIDSGSTEPYYLEQDRVYSDIDTLLKDLLVNQSKNRGVFLELPSLDLNNIIELKKYKKINQDNIFFNNYYFDEMIEISMVNEGLDGWVISGDIEKIVPIKNFDIELKKLINNFLSKKINNLLEKEKIDLNKKNNINIIVSNISSTNDLNIFKSQINQLISVKDLYIASISNNKISYNAVTYGEFSSIVKEINSGIFLNEIEVNNQLDVIKLVYNK